jgi:hypothetical protein
LHTFCTVREAKDYLAGRVAEEAKQQGVPLTEVERKMLYFSETGWTLPDMMVVNAEFDRDYNQDEYEEKIGRLVHRIQERQNSGDDQQREEWCCALETFGGEDHYLLILIDGGSKVGDREPSDWGKLGSWLPDLGSAGKRSPGDAGRLILMSIVVTAVLFVAMWFWASIKR